MKRSTRRAAAAGAVLLLGPLAGCSGDDSSGSSDSPEASPTTEASGEEYCAALEEAQTQFESLDESDFTQFDDVFATFRQLSDQSPEEVAAEWDTLVTGFDQLEQAVEDAGLTLDELAAVQQDPQSLPEGVDLAELQALGPKLQELQTPEFNQAGEAITTHAEEECGISLDDGAGAPTETPTQ